MVSERSRMSPRRMIPLRGSARVPGADLRRLPIRVDLAGVSLLEGLRTTIAAGVSLFADTWLNSDLLLVFGVAALLVCFSDSGGPLRQRVWPLLALTVIGSIIWPMFGILRGLGLPYVLPATALCVLANSMARVWGLPGQSVGNVLTVIIALALDAPLRWAAAPPIVAAFMAGGLWAVLLTVVIMGIRPHRPATHAVSEVWTMLASLAADLLALLYAADNNAAPSPAEWDAHARVHRRGVRDAIERARIAVAATFRVRGPSSPQSMTNLLRLEMSERVFGALIALSDLIEHAPDATVRYSARRLLRRLRPLLTRMGGRSMGDARALGRAIDRLTADRLYPAGVINLAGTIAEWLRAAARLKIDSELASIPMAESLPASAEGSLWEALRSNFTWDSAILRHAVRVTVVTVPVFAVDVMFWTPYSHWLTYSVALTMQPFFSGTWQRVLERCAGTVAGALLGGALAFLPQTPVAHALTLLPLCILGFSARQVSYGAFIACLTPLVVLLFDMVLPGQSEWTIAGMRVAYTLAGGAIAIAAGLWLWPSWEPQRVREEVRRALRAHADYAAAVLARLAGMRGGEAIGRTQRAAGVAINNLEAALSRALQEPLRGRRTAVRGGLIADGALRRLGACLVTLSHAPAASEPEREAWARWATWLPEALSGLGADAAIRPAPELPQAAPVWREAAERIRRHVEIVSGALGGNTG